MEEHTADVCLVVEAASWVELCEEAARACGGFMSGGQVDEATGVEEELVMLSGVDRNELWVRWWRALLRSWLVGSRLAVAASIEGRDDELELRARPRTIALEELDPTRCVDVKAVTWHGARVVHEGGVWRGRIVLDV